MICVAKQLWSATTIRAAGTPMFAATRIVFRCAVAAAFVLAAAPASSDVLFSGGWLDAGGKPAWGTRIGTFKGDGSEIKVHAGDSINGVVHAEAHRLGTIGTDFEYSADVTVRDDAEGHLQFRISDDGRYGVLLGTQRFVIYRFQRVPYLALTPPRDCAPQQPGAITHCPEWSMAEAARHTQSDAASNWTPLDPPIFEQLRSCPWPDRRAVRSGLTYHLSVTARGPSLRVLLDGFACETTAPSPALTVGRFGLYVYGAETAVKNLTFRSVQATTDPAALVNFALLYSTLGYEARGTKRALVRTLTDVRDTVVNARLSTFTLRSADGRIVKTGLLRRLRGKTFGMQLWEADFSDVSAEGVYRLDASISVPSGLQQVRSAAFEIRSKLITNRVLKPMSIVNADIRRGADEDFWRNWIRESGSWHVGVDGAFVADHADAGAGATLTRVFNINNEALDLDRPGLPPIGDFRIVGRITIVSGCDAQLRFEDTARRWWAVTLQAGAGGGCPFGDGPGAVRVSVEDADGFTAFESRLFPPDHALLAGEPHDLELLVRGDTVEVFLDSVQGSSAAPFLRQSGLPPRSGRFGLKAWAATARFEDVQAWKPDVTFVQQPRGSVRIPTFRNAGTTSDPPVVPCQYAPRVCPNGKCRQPVNEDEAHDACNPIFGQLHGFHDSSSMVAEATSHGAFLSGLMQTWKRRASAFTQPERESLRRAIVANVLYLEMLLNESGTPGQFAHSEMGRVAVDTNGPYSTVYALYGLSDFAADGEFVDVALANRACDDSIAATKWLWPGGALSAEPVLASIVYTRLARCVARRGIDASPYWTAALAAANTVIDIFSRPEGFRDQDRSWSRIVPWFEGVHELTRYAPTQTSGYPGRLVPIATALVHHLLENHRCRTSLTIPSRGSCAPNGFEVVPQASGDQVKQFNWEKMQLVPRSDQVASEKGPGWYNVNGHFPTAAVDAILLARLTGNQKLGRLAAGNLYWGLGLNPGIPAAKIVRAVPDGTVWQSAAFIYRLDAAFARAHQSFRLDIYSAKGWLDWWEDRFDAPHREAWRIDPQNRFSASPSRSLLSFVNGHVIWDAQWDYWNSGAEGWQSGETFIMSDGAFLKAALLFEDWLENGDEIRANPYDTSRVAFFDTSHVDRVGTGWRLDDPDRTAAAHASRAVHEFCRGKGFAGGRFTGHVVGELVGALCAPTTAAFFDLETPPDVIPWDINTTAWAMVARMATTFCGDRQFAGGFFTGHQLNGRHGVVCLGSDAAVSGFDATPHEIAVSGFPFDNINTVAWAPAARAATNVCLARGFAGGFFTGHQTRTGVGLVCLVP
jgi:hypothetical protein